MYFNIFQFLPQMERDKHNQPGTSSFEMSDDIRKYLDASSNVFPLCKDVRRYQKLMKIGQGTFGEVFKAKHRKTKKIVALKKIKMEQEKEGVSSLFVFKN